MTGPAGVPWRGYVNQILYGVSLRAPAGDDLVDGLATKLIEQRVFTNPVERYYDAVRAGLRSGEPLAVHEEFQAEDAVRDLLARLVRRLDERRPWPEHPFYALDESEWGERAQLFDGPVIARIPRSPFDVGDHLFRVFTSIRSGGAEVYVLVLRLRTGQLVVLRSTAGYAAPGVELLAHTDPGSTITAFRELTGLEADPV